MTGHQLKMWRKRGGYNQDQAAKLVGITQASWSRYENGAQPVPADIDAYCMANPTERAQLPESDHVAAALAMADKYIYRALHIDTIYGKACPTKWAISFWMEGALRVPAWTWGPKGKNANPAALAACNARLAAVFDTGAIMEVWTRLDDCPAWVKAKYAASYQRAA